MFLQDIDLIDVLWRSDIEVEKGRIGGEGRVEPSEQYERDLQLLTEKSIQAVSNHTLFIYHLRWRDCIRQGLR